MQIKKKNLLVLISLIFLILLFGGAFYNNQPLSYQSNTDLSDRPELDESSLIENDLSDRPELDESSLIENDLSDRSELDESSLIENDLSDRPVLELVESSLIENDMTIFHYNPQKKRYIYEYIGTSESGYNDIYNSVYTANGEFIDTVTFCTGYLQDMSKRIIWLSNNEILFDGIRVYSFDTDELCDITFNDSENVLKGYIDSYDINNSRTKVCYIINYNLYIYDFFTDNITCLDGVKLNSRRNEPFSIRWLDENTLIFENYLEDSKNIYLYDLITDEITLKKRNARLINFDKITDQFIHDYNDPENQILYEINTGNEILNFEDIIYIENLNLYLAVINEANQQILVILDSNYDILSRTYLDETIPPENTAINLSIEDNKIFLDSIKYNYTESGDTTYYGIKYEIKLTNK